MGSDQRLQDMPKAYADLITTASKEAADKVMAAERKARQLEHELQITKDNAVQIIDRLKKMMDDKISEVKMTFWNQQQKINELEAQLQEAEDVVSDLREKLKYVEGKHEKTSLVASNKENLYLNQRTEYAKRFGEVIQMRNLFGAMPELPSILQRSKEHKFYQNRCTQRIQACEKDILDCELSLSRLPSDESGKGKVEGAKKDTSTCKITTDEAHNMFNIVSKEAVCKDGCTSCWYEVQTIDLILKAAKTATNAKYRKKRPALNKKIPDKLFRKLHVTPAVPQLDPTPIPVEKSDLVPVDLSVPIVQEGAPTECLDIQVCKSNLNKVGESISLPELKTFDVTGKLELFKYTFQRKRKRETMRIFDGNASSENFTPE